MPDFLKKHEKAAGDPVPKSSARPRGGRAVALNLVSRAVTQSTSRSTIRKNLTAIAASFFGACALVGFLFVLLFFYGQTTAQRTVPLRDQLAATNGKIASIEAKASSLNAFQGQLTTVKRLLENHLYWTEFFTQVEKHTLPSVSFENLSISTQTYTVSTTGYAPDYATVGKQLLAFQNASDVFSSVQISSANAQIDSRGKIAGVQFGITFAIDPKILKNKEFAQKN